MIYYCFSFYLVSLCSIWNRKGPDSKCPSGSSWQCMKCSEQFVLAAATCGLLQPNWRHMLKIRLPQTTGLVSEKWRADRRTDGHDVSCAWWIHSAANSTHLLPLSCVCDQGILVQKAATVAGCTVSFTFPLVAEVLLIFLELAETS
jgi:hypothetical protein